MADKGKKGHGGNRKHGRNSAKCKLYASSHQRERNKIKRVLQSNGMAAAEAYAKKYGVRVPGVRV